jgi:hypothetical protein
VSLKLMFFHGALPGRLRTLLTVKSMRPFDLLENWLAYSANLGIYARLVETYGQIHSLGTLPGRLRTQRPARTVNPVLSWYPKGRLRTLLTVKGM